MSFGISCIDTASACCARFQTRVAAGVSCRSPLVVRLSQLRTAITVGIPIVLAALTYSISSEYFMFEGDAITTSGFHSLSDAQLARSLGTISIKFLRTHRPSLDLRNSRPIQDVTSRCIYAGRYFSQRLM